MRALYDAELSFYFSSVFMLLFWEVRRNDFAVMFTHHIVTVGLLAASLANGWGGSRGWGWDWGWGWGRVAPRPGPEAR